MVIHIAKSDITEMPVDAVVNPANSLGIMGGGVAGALSRKGGPSHPARGHVAGPHRGWRRGGHDAGQLWAKHVIHAPTMEEPGEKVGVENVRRATRAALIAAAHHELRDHRPAGHGDRPRRRRPLGRRRAIVDELRAHRQPKPTTVYLVDLNDNILRCLEEALVAPLRADPP